MQLYEELAPTDEHYNNAVKKQMLDKAARNVPELHLCHRIFVQRDR